MKEIKINLVPEKESLEQKPFHPEKKPKKIKKGYSWTKIIASLIIIVIVCLAVFSSSIVFSDESLIKNISKLDLLQQVGKLIGSRNKDLKGENDDRINIVIIGMGGSSHESGNLADTIILGSFKPSTKQVAMMSIPRDLSVYTSKYNQSKINAIHAYAEANNPGSGGPEMISALSDLLETEINYYVTVDFNGFEKIIDEFGGVDIDVERDLIDPQYPIRGKEFIYPLENRFETLHIKQGLQHMDGSLALKYARSRHGVGVEGSDFARSARQQKILTALKEKIFTVDTLLNTKKINSLLSAYNNHIKTNLEIWEIIRLAQYSREVNTKNIINQSLTNRDGGLLYATMLNGSYILLPKDKNFDEIKNLWKYIFYKQEVVTDNDIDTTDIAPLSTSTPTKPEEAKTPADEISYNNEGAKIEIQNGTWIAGYAGRESTKLENKGFNIVNAINAQEHDYEKTIIYDISGSGFPQTASELEKIYNIDIINNIPLNIDSSADFVIILGQN